MRWANFLHIYQPAEQQPDILEAIVVQSYRPILKHIAENKNVRLTFNINGSLLELFDKFGYRDLIDYLRIAGEEGRIEFTGCAKYHAFLPLMDEATIKRQIEANNDTCKFYLGESYKPRGFFPPEMAYTPSLAPILEKLGFEWVILDEIAATGVPGEVDYSKVHKIKDSSLMVYFRERRTSNLIMSAVVRSPETLHQALKDELLKDRYLVTAMDGETFGHHRPGLEKFLFDVWQSPELELIKVSEIADSFKSIKEVSPIPSTWASSKEDIDRSVQFLSWYDPENAIHHWQWELFHLVDKEMHKMDKSHPRFLDVQKRMDIATASDHFWWASAKPWWSVEMIEDGAFRLLDTVRTIPDVAKETLARSGDLYEKIISTAFNWQRTGKIRTMMKEQGSILRIPFKDRTIGRGGAEEGVYHAFVDMMKGLEREASGRGEYEKAILWRDAIYKLENNLDIYDTINAIDLLRVEVPHDTVEATIEKYKKEYQKIRGGQPEQRGS